MTAGRIFVHDAPKHAVIPRNVNIQNFECPSPVVRLSSVRLSVRQSVRLSGRVGSAPGAYLKAPFRASQSVSHWPPSFSIVGTHHAFVFVYLITPGSLVLAGEFYPVLA